MRSVQTVRNSILTAYSKDPKPGSPSPQNECGVIGYAQCKLSSFSSGILSWILECSGPVHSNEHNNLSSPMLIFAHVHSAALKYFKRKLGGVAGSTWALDYIESSIIPTARKSPALVHGP